MTTPGQPSGATTATGTGFESLGSGETDDRLGFRTVVGILVRCIPLLSGVGKHLFVLFAGTVAITLAGFGFALVFVPLLWEGVLQGKPVPALGAVMFGLDPAAVVHVESIAADVRLAMAERLTSSVLLAFVLPILIVGSALYYYYVWILQRVNQRLRLELVDRLQALSLRFHQDTQVGDAIYRTYQDSAMVTQLINVLFMAPLGAILQYIGVVVLVAAFDPKFSILVAAALPAVVGLGYYFSRRLRVRFRIAREANSRLTSRIQESLSGIRVIKAYGLEDYERERFERSSHEAFGAAFRARNLLATFGVVVFWSLGFFVIASTLYATLSTRAEEPLWLAGVVAGTRLESALMSAGFTVWGIGWYNLFKGVFSAGTGGLNGLFKVWGRAQDIVIGLDRVFEILDLEPEVQDRPDARVMPRLSQSVAFRNVEFAYQPDRPILHDLSAEAQSGTITALVGPTGSGKSTLMALLMRLFDPDSGCIEIDGVDLREFRIASLRRQIAIALQENVLFGSSIRDNIAYGVDNATDEEVRAAARVACADEFIEALPEAYDTMLGERGAKLSTGQRQRISIARALLKDTSILVLDEPTSSLDAETEARLILNLGKWGEGRCIFLITHRLSTIRMADQIIFLEAGRVLETASHDELMMKPDGAYRGLVEAEQNQAAEAYA